MATCRRIPRIDSNRLLVKRFNSKILRTTGVIILLCLSGCYAIAPKDADGKRPEDVGRRFAEYVRAKDYKGAASCWHAGDVGNIERNRNTSFEKYCEYFDCDTYQVEPEKLEKKIYWISFTGWKDGKKRTHWLFLEHPSREKDGRWRLTEDWWGQANEQIKNRH
jgi:hypothetical protein